MNVIADLCVVPLGVGVSLSRYVAACEAVLLEAGLQPVLHANGTNVEGDWEVVFQALRRCHERLHSMGAPRINTILKIGTRTDRAQSMEDKVLSVQAKLGALRDPSTPTKLPPPPRRPAGPVQKPSARDPRRRKS